MLFSERLRYLIDLKKINPANLAYGVGVDRSRVSMWMKGKTKAPQRKTLQKLADFFGCNINWLADGEGDPFSNQTKPNQVTMTQNIGKVTGSVSTIHGEFSGNINIGHPEKRSKIAELHQIPVLGRVPAGIPNTLAENVEDYVQLPGSPPDCYALRVSGESMAPGIVHGDYVLFVIDREAKPGDIVVVNDEFGDSMVKRLKEKGEEDYLVSDNPSYPTYRPNENYRIMGVVVGCWRQVKI